MKVDDSMGKDIQKWKYLKQWLRWKGLVLVEMMDWNQEIDNLKKYT